MCEREREGTRREQEHLAATNPRAFFLFVCCLTTPRVRERVKEHSALAGSSGNKQTSRTDTICPRARRLQMEPNPLATRGKEERKKERETKKGEHRIPNGVRTEAKRGLTQTIERIPSNG